jgi:predicted nucleic acid-binding protein
MNQGTTFVIDVLRGHDDAEALLSVLESESRPRKVSAVTVLELYEGVARANTPDDK